MASKSTRAARRGTSAIVTALRKLADSKDRIRYKALDPLSGADSRSAAEFREEWQKIAAERRREIATAMLDTAEEYLHTDFTELFHVMLDDSDEVVRSKAVGGLWTEDSPSYGKRLMKIFADDGSALVRAAAATGLGNFLYEAEMEETSVPPGAEIAKLLLARFNEPGEDLEVRRRALEAVAWSSDERVHSAIQSAYDEGDRDMRISAVFAMGRSADKAWVPTVVRELRSDDAALRYEAANAAGELSASDAMPRLVKMVDDPDGQVREAVVWALGQIGGNEARRILERIVEEGPESLVESAEEALAEIDVFAELESFNMFDFEVASLEDVETPDDDEKPNEQRRPRAN